MPITNDDHDALRFLLLLRHFNDEFKSENWEREISLKRPFDRPEIWPEQKPLARVLAWTLMPNHFHLILEEMREGGVSKLMQKVGNSMTSHFNLKYTEKGSIFQGAYKSRTISSDGYLRYLAPYVMVKNPFELFPGGVFAAWKHFDEAWEWAKKYSFSSLSCYTGIEKDHASITSQGENALKDIFPNQQTLKDAAKDMFEAHMEKRKDEILDLTLLEDW